MIENYFWYSGYIRTNGLLYKKDDIRGFAAVSQDFTDLEKEKIFNLYVTDDQMKTTMDGDNKKYFESLAALGIEQGAGDPVAVAYSHYNKNLFRADVIAELGTDEATFNTILNTEPFKSAWVSIYTNSGSITRSEFNLLYGDAVNAFSNGLNWAAPVLGDHLATPSCMVSEPALMDNCTDSFLAPVVEEPVAAN